MDITAHRSVFGRPANMRALALFAVLALVILAVVAVAVGSRRPLPPPYGLARNGAVISSADGDMFSIDPATYVSTPLITGPKFDFGPVFSRDGTKFAFLRGGPTDCGEPDCGLILVIADADGSAIREITPASPGLDWLDWSPDGTRIAFLSGTEGRHRINVVNVDGTGIKTLTEVVQPANQLSWLPPDGREILFRGEHLLDSDPPAAIFAIRPDGSGLRQISTRPALDGNDYQDLSVSPDGARLAYRAVAPNQPFRIHVLDIRTGVDRVLPEAAGSAGEGGAIFSPDGRSVVYLRWALAELRVGLGAHADITTQLVVAPVDGSGTGIAVGPHVPLGSDGPTIGNYGFTPDGTAVIASYGEQLNRKLPVDGSPGTVLSRGDMAFVTYQRLAP